MSCKNPGQCAKSKAVNRSATDCEHLFWSADNPC